MKKVLVGLILVVGMGFFTSCTENQRAKNFGGSAEIDLPVGQKLVTVTWKDADLWYLTRDRLEHEPIQNYTFQEESSWGMMEGSYTINEK